MVSKASWHGHTELLEWLVAHAGAGPQLFQLNHIGELPVQVAAQADNAPTVGAMLRLMHERSGLPGAPCTHVAEAPERYRDQLVPFTGSPVVHQHKSIAARGPI